MAATIEVGTTAWRWDALAPADALCRQAEVAEAMGFASFWLPENHFGQRGARQRDARQRNPRPGGARQRDASLRGAIPAPLLLLAAIAARTQRIRLGCTSYLLPIRHPLLVAEEVAVLDQLCQGRLILGLGRGLSGAMFKAFGVPASDKRKLFQAHLDIMRRAWRGESLGEDDDGAPIHLSPLPLQQPSPPLWVAAFGPLALQQVAALGLPYLASPIESLETLEQNYRRFHHDMNAAGHAPVHTVPIMRTVFVTEDDALADQVRTTLALPSGRQQQPASVDDWALVGDRRIVREKLAGYIERLSLSHLIVRAGIPGISEQQQFRSHETLLEIVSTL